MRRVRRTLWILLAGIALMSVPLRAEAQESGGSSRGNWYGWQTLIVTGASHATIAPLYYGGGYGVALSGAGLLVGPPIVHFAHGNVGKGFVSLGINTGGALVGAGVGFAVRLPADSGKGDWAFYGPMIGAFIGATAANIVDASVLAYDRGGSGGYGIKLGRRSTVSFLPTADIRPGRGSVGVAGTF